MYVYLFGMVQEEVRVMRIPRPENDGGGGHGGSCLSGEIRPRIALINLIRPTRRRHVLRPLPTVVVGVSIPNLNTKFISFYILI